MFCKVKLQVFGYKSLVSCGCNELFTVCCMPSGLLRTLHVHMYTYVYVCIRMYTYVYVCTYVWCVCVYMFVLFVFLCLSVASYVSLFPFVLS